MFRTFLILSLVALTLAVPQKGVASETIKVMVSGGAEPIDAFTTNGVSYFSFSGLVDVLGGVLDWEMVGQRIKYVEDTNHFEFVIGSPFILCNGAAYNITYPAVFSKGQLFLPALTFLPHLDQVLQQTVTWESGSAAIRIDSKYFNVVDFGIEQKANGILAEIFLTNAMSYDVFVTEGNWVNVSIRDAKINTSKILSRGNSRFLYKLKAINEEGTGQVSFQLKTKVDQWSHKLVSDPPRIQIAIADVNFSLDSVEAGPRVGPDNLIDVVVIDPGHGGDDYGAVGPGGSREKDVVLDIAKELAKLIRKEKQFKVIMTRNRDKTLTLQERADIANGAGADVFISIHANSALKRPVRGWNVFFLAAAKNDSARAVAQFENSAFLREQTPRNPEDDSGFAEGTPDPVLNIINEMIMTEFQSESHDFALMLDRELRRKLDIEARGVDQAGFFVLNMVFTPSVLIESGFISNPTEEKLLKSSRFQKGLAEAIYDALQRFKAKYESK